MFITARLKNVKFFGENDITYPLYNFQISKDKDNRYQTMVSDNIDHVRIVDNSLYSPVIILMRRLALRPLPKRPGPNALARCHPAAKISPK
jgi:hypothetical protein